MAKATTDDTEKDPGRGRGGLEVEIIEIVDDLIKGKRKLPEGIDKITPHAVGRLLKERDNLDAAPSTGAVAANFNRWADYGVINAGTSPHHVKGWTAGFKKLLEANGGKPIAALKAAKDAYREKAKKARAAAKPAADTAKKAPAKKAAGSTKKAAGKKAPAKKAAAAAGKDA